MFDPGAAITSWLAQLQDRHVPLVTLFLFVSAMVEHLFPPYPGDLAVAFGAAVGVAKRWPVVWLFLSAVMGSTTGSAAMFALGRWLGTRPHKRHGPRVERLRAAAHKAADAIDRHGVMAIVLSRFVPVGRAVIVVAAGYGGMSVLRALLASAAGAVLWNTVLFAVGGVVGMQHARIAAVLSAYTRVVYAVVLFALLAWGVRKWLARKSRGSQ